MVEVGVEFLLGFVVGAEDAGELAPNQFKTESHKALVDSNRELAELVDEFILDDKSNSVKSTFFFRFSLPIKGITTSVFFEMALSLPPVESR